MKRGVSFMLAASIALCSCTSARLSQDEARKKIAQMGQSNLIPDAVEIRRIVSQTDTKAIAEATVTLAFQFSRPTSKDDWRIEAVRLGDRDWISLDELLTAINESRQKSTSESMQHLAEGIERYRAAHNGSLPDAKDITKLTDTLHPAYMTDLARDDGWGHPILYEVTGSSTFRFVSTGADGRLGTLDDIVLEGGRLITP